MQTNLKMIKGDTLAFAIELEFDESPQDLQTAFFSVKESVDDSDPLIQKSLSNGISKIKTDGNKIYYRVRIAPEDTASIDVREYYYDLEIGINNDVFTVLNGILKVEHEITI